MNVGAFPASRALRLRILVLRAFGTDNATGRAVLVTYTLALRSSEQGVAACWWQFPKFVSNRSNAVRFSRPCACCVATVISWRYNQGCEAGAQIKNQEPEPEHSLKFRTGAWARAIWEAAPAPTGATLMKTKSSGAVACRGGGRTGRRARASKARGASKERNYKNLNAVTTWFFPIATLLIHSAWI